MIAKKDLQFAIVSTDILVLRNNKGVIEYATQVINRAPHYVHIPALIGGVLKPHETSLDAVKRIIHEKTKYSSGAIECLPLGFYDEIGRDKRGRVVSLAYLGIMNTCEEKEDVTWQPFHKPIKLAYDHNKMVKDTEKYLREHLYSTVLGLYFMKDEFTIGELQGVYEYLLGKKVDKRNFYKFIAELPITATKKMKQEGRGRPAVIYKKKELKQYLLERK